jgi:F0F1-type ATP synthase assembly protein I
MEPQNDLPPLKTLEEDIHKFQRKTNVPKTTPEQSQGMRAALRMGLELASGVLVGAGVGILLDTWFGTSPILCIICFLLGAGGGFLTIYRTMQQMDGGEVPAAPEMDEDDD